MEEWEAMMLAHLTRDLVALRQKECGHLCIENQAPELLAKLKFAWNDPHGYLHRVCGVGSGS